MQSSRTIGEVTTRDVAAAAVAPLRHVRDAFDRSVALVLGVNTYRHGIPRLKTAVPDAEAVGALLEAHHGFTTLLRCDAEVTSARVRSILTGGFRDELHGALTERDRLLIYFAGHGLSLPSEHGPEGQLLLADADPADPRSYFAMSELRQLVGALPCRHVLIVLDCCFAGTFRWAGKGGDREVSAPAYRETLERFVHHRAWQVLVSASHDQTAADAVAMDPPSGPLAPRLVDALGSTRIETASHSPFAAALLRGLQGEADFTNDKLIIAAELELFVRDVVERATHVHQTPQLYKLAEHDRGEFVFQVPGSTLDLAPAPALSIAACPYQGLQPYRASERGRFFGRTQVLQALVDRVIARSFTAVVGPSGIGKSSLLAAGLLPALRAMPAWTALEARPGTTPDDPLRDLVAASSEGGLDPGGTLVARIASWMASHANGRLCLIVDQAEALAGAEARARVLAELAQALDAHGDRLRVVLGLSSELEPVFRASALGPRWGDERFVVPALTQDELREIIEQPARLQELSFEPPELVDSLINEVLQAPGGLPLLSFMLRELYLGCVERNRDRLLTQHDYRRIGGLSGAACRRASELVAAFVARDTAFAATARRVFLRMVVRRDGGYVRRRVPHDELVYADEAENARVDALLTALQDARLVVLDKNAWEPAHDDLVRAWDALSTWRLAFGDPALDLEHALADAARRWDGTKRSGELWHGDKRLRPALRAARDPDTWLSAREQAFVAASVRRRRIPILAAAALLVLGLAAVLTRWELYARPHVAYYVNYVRRWGAPEGVDRLSESEARLRKMSFKFVRDGRLGHVSHMERVRDGERPACTDLTIANLAQAQNAAELTVGRNEAPKRLACQWDFAYEPGTRTVSTETARGSAGQVLYKLHYRSGPRARRIAEFLQDNGFDASISRGDAELVEFVRSPQGFDEEKRYLLRTGQPARDGSRVSTEKLRSDDRGHVIQVSSLDVSGRPTWILGVAGARMTYDDRGNLIATMFVDEAGAPLWSNELGFAGWHVTFDDRGDAIEHTWVDEAGQPTCSKDGIAGWRSTYDDRGNETLRLFVDEAGKPFWRNDEAAGARFTYDARDNQTEVALVDELSRPTRNAAGVAGWRQKYDERGNDTELAFFDQAGRPVRNNRGVAGFRAKYDERDNHIEHMFLDEAGKPMRDKQGLFWFRMRFDQRRNEIEHVFLDETGKPTRSRDGNAGWSSTFDDWGKETEHRFIDERGQPVRNRDGIAGWRSTFDDHGKMTEATSINEDGQPCRDLNGLVGWRAKFDERGNEIEKVFVDETSRPTLLNNGVSGVRSKFDGRGNEIERMFLDKQGAPTRRNDGLAGWRSRFNKRGKEIERAFVDETGQLARNEDGFASWRSTLDARGNATETVYFDEAGRPTRNQEGVASCRARYDERGEKLERACFDAAGQPALTKDGYASWRATYDGRGNQTAIVYFDQAGQPVLRR